MPTNSDSTRTDELLERARGGDPSAVNHVLDEHRAYLHRVIELRMDDRLRQRLDTSDVIQETQLRAAQRMEEYLRNPTISFRLWLRQKAIEQMIDFRRRHLAKKRSVQREVPLPEQSSIALARQFLRGRPSQQLEQSELAERVREAMARMGDKDREILQLRHYESLSNGEVAELLGLESATASQRYGRALRRFREELINSGISGA